VDWQQGEKSSVVGIDPLFMLNHFHFIDSGRDGKLPLTFSRYAGIGSHRYPLGFSGDTMSTWKSLDFQPYFTTNASNVGYSWWSHDIGGHQKGRRDDEMVARWVQYGTFSPIMRLHSTANAFYGKEPWNYNLIVENTISDFMRLRHKLVPYLHTMNYRNHLEGRPLVEPMYYRHDRAEAYKNKNQYYFGDLIVCPITEQNDAETWLGSSKAWIPEGTYVDVFNGLEYRGPKEIKLFRDITTMPVLAKKGSIIPMAKDLKNVCVNNPKVLDVHVFAGENGNFDLYEDDCSEMQKMPLAVTKFTLKSKKDITLEVKPTGDISVIPEDRTYNFIFHNMKQGEKISVITENGKETDEYNLNYDESGKKFTISYKDKGNQGFKLTIFGGGELHDLPDKITLINKLLNRAQIEYDIKEKCQWILREEPIPEEALRKMERIGAKANITEAVEDILLSDAL
ncbi:MAG: DUF5110 domain-containing protein, partial [Lachnospiraceae bacterium]|nr:DUF5110 domain-containing protein [Lachnospiraceae bacterium]